MVVQALMHAFGFMRLAFVSGGAQDTFLMLTKNGMAMAIPAAVGPTALMVYNCFCSKSTELLFLFKGD